MNPLELIGAQPWRRVTFTTYALSLSFFESVVLDALVRGGSRSALILADVEGVRGSLSEIGARRAGREYEVEPISVSHGVFHPKITVLASDDDCHLLVGSGNLTFGGWGGNLEVLEHLHPSFAADAFYDVAELFDRLGSSTDCRHGVGAHCRDLADQLHRTAVGHARNGEIRVLHSVGSSIADKLVEIVEELGGATRLVVASPFWDGGSAIDLLAARLGLGEVFVHSHPGGCVEGRAGSNWPHRASTQISPVRLYALEEESPRRMHAKLFEVSCREGRVLLTGSANATTAALGVGGNVEASVVRIQRGSSAAWEFIFAERPVLNTRDEEEDDTEAVAPVGVLRAVLENDRLVGEVLVPRLKGKAEASRLSSVGSTHLGWVELGANSEFTIDAPGLELESWKGGRIVLRLQLASGQRAEGYVSVAAYAEIQRRAGTMVARLIALMTGTETPADVAAIMTWIHENPDRLLSSFGEAGGGGDGGDKEEAAGTATVAVDELDIAHAVTGRFDDTTKTGVGRGWARFLDQLFASLRERRNPIKGGAAVDGEEVEDEEGSEDPEVDSGSPEKDKAFATFARLLDSLLEDKHIDRHASSAFELTTYICRRLEPERADALHWLTRSVEAILRSCVPEHLTEAVAAAILAIQAGEPGDGAAQRARRRMLKLGVDVGGEPPSVDSMAFRYLAPSGIEVASAWAAIRATRTPEELIRSYLASLASGDHSDGFESLQSLAPEEWPALDRALTSLKARARLEVIPRWLDACPKCFRTLPLRESHKLRDHGVATARNCCSRVLIVRGD